jgi:hypothetical protein
MLSIRRYLSSMAVYLLNQIPSNHSLSCQTLAELLV